jgi:hypothetical protein
VSARTATAASPRGLAQRARAVAAPASRRQLALALLVYTVATVVLTWPLVTDLSSTIYLSPARPVGDYTSIIAHLRELVQGFHNPFQPGRIEDFNAPHGFPIAWVVNSATFASTIVLYVLALVFGATAAVGLFVMLGFILSGTAMFLLVRRLTGSAWIGLIIGWAFAFYPYVVSNGEHPHHIHGWVFVVMAWRVLELAQRPTVRNGLWAGLAAVLTFAWTPYFILLGGVCYATLVLATVIWAWRHRQLRAQLLPQAVGLAIPLAFLIAMRALALVDEQAAAITPGVTLVDVFAQTARPLNYVVPSGHNPIVGEWSRGVLEPRGLFDNTEKQLYVGWTLIALAMAGGVASLRARLPGRQPAVGIAFAAVTFVALAFSAPPKVAVAGHLIPFPSLWVFELNSAWRIYSRFVIVVMLGLCIVAALGLRWLTAGRSHAVAVAILAAFSLLVPLDLWARHDNVTGKLGSDPIYATLRAQPPGIVAEYPIQPSAFAENYNELYNQQFHDKPILNGFPARTADEARALSLASLEDPVTPGRLAALGVRYVLLKHAPTIDKIPKAGRPGRGFRLIARDGYASLYRVTAAPTGP